MLIFRPREFAAQSSRGESRIPQSLPKCLVGTESGKRTDVFTLNACLKELRKVEVLIKDTNQSVSAGSHLTGIEKVP